MAGSSTPSQTGLVPGAFRTTNTSRICRLRATVIDRWAGSGRATTGARTMTCLAGDRGHGSDRPIPLPCTPGGRYRLGGGSPDASPGRTGGSEGTPGQPPPARPEPGRRSGHLEREPPHPLPT